MNPVRLMRPDVRFEDVEPALRKILDSGQLTAGPFVERFEREVATFVGTAHAVATTSATTALHLTLHALGVGAGDEVAVADFTFPATANAVIQTGATPVFVDSGADDFAMCPDDLADKLSDRTVAVLPVDPFGQPADYGRIEELAATRGLPVLADAACSLGAERDGRRAGSHGIAGCFSFHPRKIVTCGEGGMITTDDADLAGRLRLLRSHGGVRAAPAMRFDVPGFNYRMSEIQAALGSSQMDRLDTIMADRRRVADAYDTRLAGVQTVTVPRPGTGTRWSYQSYVVVLDDGLDRDRIIVALRDAGVETTLGTYATHAHPAYRSLGVGPGDLPNSHRFQQQALTLPLVPRMPETDVDLVVNALGAAIDEQHRA